MTCDTYRARVLMSADGPEAASGDLSEHLAACPACRMWSARFRTGLGLAEDTLAPDWLAAVSARTSGGACDRARTLLTSFADDPPTAVDQVLLRDHLQGCQDCRRFDAQWAVMQLTLPSLAIVDPGPAFTVGVLDATSRRPPQASWAARVSATWRLVISRPRFAWEVAYVCTLCWLLVFGNPIRAFDWTTARLGAVSETAAARTGAITELKRSVEASSWWPSGDDVARVAGQVADSLTTKVADVTGWPRVQAWAATQMTGWLDVLEGWWRAIVSWFADEPPASPVRSSQ